MGLQGSRKTGLVVLCVCDFSICLPDVTLMGLSTDLWAPQQSRAPQIDVLISQLPLATLLLMSNWETFQCPSRFSPVRNDFTENFFNNRTMMKAFAFGCVLLAMYLNTRLKLQLEVPTATARGLI